MAGAAFTQPPAQSCSLPGMQQCTQTGDSWPAYDLSRAQCGGTSYSAIGDGHKDQEAFCASTCSNLSAGDIMLLLIQISRGKEV